MQISLTTELLNHQRIGSEKLSPIRVGALFADMGTGKSRLAIELAARRMQKIDRVVWFTLVSLKETVRTEILKHTNSQPGDICVFDGKITDGNIPECSWYIIGLESLGSSNRVVLAANKVITERSLVIVDESDYIKGHRAKRTNRVTLISSRARYRLILTGTPISQGIQDLYSQMRFLSEKILGYRSWYSFAHNHLEYSDRYKGLIVKAHNTAWLAAKIAPYVYQITKEECLDLPEKIFDNYYCRLTNEQETEYDLAKGRFCEEVLAYDTMESKFRSSLPIFRLFSTLQSIVCGFVRDEATGEVRSLDHNRIELLKGVLTCIPPENPVVIWAKYHHCRRDIVNSLADRPVFQYHGMIDEKKRHRELNAWCREGGVLVATQDAGGHGLNELVISHDVIFYANGFKYSTRIQAEDRNHRIGQKHTVSYADLWARCGIENRIALSIERKGNAVAEFKSEVDNIKGSIHTGIKKLMEDL